MAKGKGQSGSRGRSSSKKSSATSTPGSDELEAGASKVAGAGKTVGAALASGAAALSSGTAAKPGAGAGRGDMLKWALVALIVLVAISAFYILGEYSTLLRVVLLLILLGGAAFVAMRTASGNAAFEFVKDSRVELRKVVWPTRKETIQTTGLILVVVVIAAMLIWILDMGLAALVKILIGSSA